MFSNEKVIDDFRGEYDFLSNFFVEPMVVPFDGVPILCPTLEHPYQAAKTKDPVERLRVLSAAGPGQAKRLGKSVTLRSDWEQIKVPTMMHLLRIKFSIPRMKMLLLSTGDAILIEGNWWGDRFWGVCKGEGQNWLGHLLMNLREEFRNVQRT